MKIAICDDQERESNEVEKWIKALIPDSKDYELFKYFSGEALLEAIHTEAFDIIFLDIEMKGINGLETARKIRKDHKRAIIVFLTNYKEFSIDGYEVGAFRYLLKGQHESVYIQKFRDIIREYNSRYKTLDIYTRDMFKKVYVDEISYFEVYRKKVTLHTIDRKQYEYNKPLCDIEKELVGDQFKKPHKSYLVNLTAIDKITKDGLLMKSGEMVPVSRNFKKEISDAYLNYMME